MKTTSPTRHLPARKCLWLAVVFTAAATCIGPSLFAYNPPEETVGPLKVSVDGPDEVKTLDRPIAISVVLANRGDRRLTGKAVLGVIDQWRAVPASKPFTIAPHATVRLNFGVVVDSSSYNAHYPIHAVVTCCDGQTNYRAHPIRIVETHIDRPPRPHAALKWRPIRLEADSALALWQLPVRRVIVQVLGEAPLIRPIGALGTEPRSHATSAVSRQSLGGDARMTLAMHPPWFDGHVGTIVAEFPIELPRAASIRLSFANAMNIGGQGDGVTFRVRVAAWDEAAGTLGKPVFERHTAAESWQAAEADLSSFAGQKVRIQLESHPGEKMNTGWDSSFWAEPTLTVGTPPAAKLFPPRDDADSRLLGKIEAGGEPWTVRLWPGRRGLLDGVIGFERREAKLFAHGFQTTVGGMRLDEAQSPARLIRWTQEVVDGDLRMRHFFATPLGALTLVGKVRVTNGVLQTEFDLADVPAPQPWRVVRIEDLAIGRWSDQIERAYAGDGNVIVKPQAYRLSFDGHRLSTSFVGYEFTSGMALVEASDVPPSYLDVRPTDNHVSLHVGGAQRRTIIPATNVWRGVKQWRRVNGLHAAAGVSNAAGRFVFDLWGGKYQESADALQRSFRYGLTDAMVIWHNWQRWGYDYRLPEIYPPNPQYGTTEQLQHLIRVCRQAGVRCAVHDNYIDFYPDADGFSYQRTIAFHQDGTPVLAWLNKGRQARSYRYRSDQVEPFLKNNLQLIRKNLSPSAYFIDVWSSAKPYDYWTADGKYYSSVYSRDTWGQLFAWIRTYLGDNAPQISESGHDQLIGYLDGAQTNHLRVGPVVPGQYGWAVWNWKCADAERVPWYDAAHHDRFVLHGAGYEPRYAAGLDKRLHGIYSDDYMATEVLTGHPAMVSRPFGRDVVRKYWLLHDVLRGVALRTIEAVEFVGGDIHRQHVQWSGGAEVWVNRGTSDWTVQGRTLPSFGFLARVPGKAGLIEASVQRRSGIIVEAAQSPDQLYVNGRKPNDRRLPIRMKVAAARLVGDHEFELELHWQADVPIPAGWTPFLHFCDDEKNIVFQASHSTGQLPTRTAGSAVTKRRGTIPLKYRAGQAFELVYGFYNPQSGARLTLTGPDVGDRRIRLGKMQLTGNEADVRGVKWVPFQPKEDPLFQRLNADGRPIDFGAVVTSGGCRLTKDGTSVVITPLPDSRDPLQVTIDWSKLPWKCPRPTQATQVSDTGQVLRQAPVPWDGDQVTLICPPTVFAIRLANHSAE